MNISAALVEDIINLEETNTDMQAVVEALKEDFNRNLNVRTSQGWYIFVQCSAAVTKGLGFFSFFSKIDFLFIELYTGHPITTTLTSLTKGSLHPELDQEESIFVNSFLEIAFLSGRCQKCLTELFADVMKKRVVS